jgi:V/A-type H+/Na+-transporting ATPase subunit F
MARAIALGEKHLVVGFTAAGVEVVPVMDEHDFARQLAIAARDPGVAIVFATEQMAALAPEAVSHFRGTSQTALLIVPSYEGATRAGFSEVRKTVERSLGVDLLGKD